MNEPQDCFYAWFRDSKLSGSTFKSINVGKIDQVRVNGGSNYKFPGKHWVSKKVTIFM